MHEYEDDVCDWCNGFGIDPDGDECMYCDEG